MIKNILFIILIALLPGCFSKKENKLVVVNVLEKELYDDCHIKGSINIPFEDLEKEIKRLNKKDTIVLYCSDYQCTASKYGVDLLKSVGFEDVYAYEAGMAEWYQQGLPVNGACQKSYLHSKNIKLEDAENAGEIISTGDLKEKIKQKLAVNITS